MNDVTPAPEALGEPQLRPKRPRWGPWATLAWALGAGAVLVASQTLGVVAYVVWQRLAHPEIPVRVETLANNGAALTLAFLISAPALIGFIAFAVHLAHRSFAEYLGLVWPKVRHILIGVAAFAAVLLLAGVAATALGVEEPAFTGDTLTSARNSGVLPLYVIAFVLCAPVQEELLFRGFLYRGFAPAIGPAVTVALTSAAWAILHLQYAWFFVAEIFVLGLVFGWLRWWSGSTLLTMLLHAVMNGLAMVETVALNSGAN